MKISLSDDLIAGDSSLAGALRDDGFKFYQVGDNIFVTAWRHLSLSGQVVVPLEVKQYDGGPGRMVYCCLTYFVPDGRVNEVVELARSESQVLGGVWVGMEATNESSARLAFGLIADEDASASELQMKILSVAEEARRVSAQLWRSASSRAVEGGVMAA